MLMPITDGEKITLKAHNGQYMVAENGGGGIVNANRSKVGDWEKFVLMKSVTPGDSGTNTGQDIKKPYSATGTMIPIPGGSVAGSPLEIPRIAGVWKDNNGIVYNYGQKNEKIWWRAPSKQFYGEGVINGNRITTTIYYEQNHTVAGKVSGTVKDIDVNGAAQRIEWEDGNSFMR